jgi:hypothetical protein
MPRRPAADELQALGYIAVLSPNSQDLLFTITPAGRAALAHLGFACEAANPPLKRQAAKLVSKSNSRQGREPDGAGSIRGYDATQTLGLRSAPAWC